MLPRKQPFIKRLKVPTWIRRPLRDLVFKLFRKAAVIDDCRAIATSVLHGLIPSQVELWQGLTALPDPDYPELGRVPTVSRSASRSDAVIITARFRSGSTMLWNLFRNVEGCTAYYEPLSHTRYFDSVEREQYVDPTHRGVEDYRAEYKGLDELAQLYRVNWAIRNFLMGPDFWDPDLERFIEVMIEKAKGRAVLQFNRIDFRLPWIQKHFPNARLIHLYRHPRDQWCSTLQDNAHRPKLEDAKQLFNPDFFLTKDGTFKQFAAYDNYYLRLWAADLTPHFPFLDETRLAHPYQMFYFIWKLSYLFGRKYCHYSVGYENLISNPEPQLEELMKAANIRNYNIEKLRALLVKPGLGKWKKYADNEWFQKHEEHCESILSDFLGKKLEMDPDDKMPPSGPLTSKTVLSQSIASLANLT